MAKKKKKTVAKKKVAPKRKKWVAEKTYGAVIQNKQVAALPVIAAYDIRILEPNKQPSVWDDEELSKVAATMHPELENGVADIMIG